MAPPIDLSPFLDPKKTPVFAPDNVPDSIRQLGFAIGEEDDENFPEAIANQALPIIMRLPTGPSAADVKQLEQWAVRYPKSPDVKNLLLMAYDRLGKEQKAEAVLDQMVQQHPRFVYGLMAKATRHLRAFDANAVDALLGGPPENLKQINPARTQFSVSEVDEFAYVAFLYWLLRENPDKATEHLRVLRDLDFRPKKELRSLKDLLDSVRRDLMQAEDDDTVSIEGTFRAEGEQTMDAPTFTHPEIEWLYSYDMSLPANKRDALLALPRPTLTADLSKVLLDMVYRYDYFGGQDWQAVTHSFGWHALLLAGELRAIECLDAVLETLRQDYGFWEYWIGDWREKLYGYYFERLQPVPFERLMAFVQEPDLNTYCKATITGSIAEIGLDDPSQRPAIEAFYDALLQFQIEKGTDEQWLDTDFNAFVIAEISNLKLTSLLPRIKEAFDQQIVSLPVTGDYDDVVKSINEPDDAPRYSTINSLADMYAYLHDPDAYIEANPRPNQAEIDARVNKLLSQPNEWASLYEEEEEEDEAYDEEDDEDHFPDSKPWAYESNQPRRVAPEPGRNDKVSVRYLDGRVVSDVKYKKVEPDVKAGKCVLL
jgi:hypothetical protein